MRRLTMPIGSGDRLDRGDVPKFFSWTYLPWLMIYRVPKSSDCHFYPKSLYGLPSNFRENTGVSLQSAPKLSANGPMMPQKYCQTDEDFNFRMEKFPVATLSKFLPYEHKMEIQLNSGCLH